MTRFETGFCVLPVGVVDAWPKLGPAARSLAVGIATFSNGEEAHPSVGTLSAKAGIRHQQTFARALRELEQAGLVETGARRGGRSKTNTYHWTGKALHRAEERGSATDPLSAQKGGQGVTERGSILHAKGGHSVTPEQIGTEEEQKKNGGGSAPGRLTGPGLPALTWLDRQLARAKTKRVAEALASNAEYLQAHRLLPHARLYRNEDKGEQEVARCEEICDRTQAEARAAA